MSEFYDRMASLYHLIYPDWDESIERQAGQLAGIIHERWGAGRRPSSMSPAGSAPRPSDWPGVGSR